MLRKLILVSKSQMILSVIKSHIHLETKYKIQSYQLSPEACYKCVTRSHKKIGLYKNRFLQHGNKEHDFSARKNWLKTKKENTKTIKKLCSCFLKSCESNYYKINNREN